MGMSTQGGQVQGRGQLVGGPAGRPIQAPPTNRYMRARVQPIARPAQPLIQPQPRPMLPQQGQPVSRLPQPRPQPRPGVGIGFGPAPITQPLSQNPLTSMVNPIFGAMEQGDPTGAVAMTQALASPVLSILGGPKSSPAPAGNAVSDPGESGMYNPQSLDSARAFNAYYQQQTQGAPGYVPVSQMKYQFNQLTPEQQMGYLRPSMAQAVGTQSPLLNTTGNFGF